MIPKQRIICINGACLSGRITGIERYVYEMLRHMDQQMDPTHLTIHLLVPRGIKIQCPSLVNIKIVPLDCNGNHKLKISAIRKYLKQNRGLYCSLSGNLCIQKGALMTIHDIRAWLFSEYDPLMFRLRVGINLLSAKLFAEHIITVSETSKMEIERALHISGDRISTISDAWDHILEVDEDPTIWDRYPNLKQGEYFYSLSSLAPHKNFKWVLENAKQHPEWTFAIAGKKWTDKEATPMPSNVVYLGYVSDEENKALMTHCKAFIHPSRYEGFGLTPLEALACGAQILVSDCSCMPEIFSTCATMIDPDDYDFDFSRMREWEEGDREALLQKYRWEISAQKWLELFKKYAT